MTEKDLRDLLDTVAERVSPSRELAETAWRSGRRRRRLTAVAGAALIAGAVTAISVGTATVDRAGRDVASRPATPSSSPRSTAPGTVQAAPGADAEARLPLADTRLRGGVDVDADRAAPLSAAPVRRAVAAFQQDPSSPVLVLGEDGRMRRIDGVRLTPNTDAGGNGAPILDSTALSADGARVALLQHDEVVVVDLPSGEARRYPVPGPNLGAVWQRDGDRLLVWRGSRGSVLLDRRSGSLQPAPYAGGDVAFAGGGAIELLSAPQGAGGGAAGRAVLRRLGPDGGLVARRELPPMISTWLGAPFVRGGLVARAAYTTRVDGLDVANPEAVAVIDTGTGRQNRLLAFGGDSGHSAGGSPVLGWLDDETVLVANLGTRIIAWNVATGELTRVVELDAASVALGEIRR